MKTPTPMQELFDWVSDNSHKALYGEPEITIHQVLVRIQSMIEKEKEIMCEFADEFSRECIDFHHAQTISPERFFELTFNTKEK